MTAEPRGGLDREGAGVEGVRVIVLGLGLSGTAAARALAAADVGDLLVVDTRDTPAVRERAAALRAAGVDARPGVTDAATLAGAGLVVTSPGVAPGNPILAAATAGGQRVWSEPELAWRLNSGRTRLVAVTGTNGKTTTTELVAACLRAPVGGNIGTPLCDLLTGADAPALAVAELSSFQLRFTDRLRADVGVLLNVAPDHLDWHGTLDDYTAAKARVWANQRPEGAPGPDGRDWAVVGVDDAGARAAAAAHPPPAGVAAATSAPPGPGEVGVAGGVIVSRLGVDTEVVAVDALPARGPHNVANAVAAVAAAVCAGADPAGLAGPLTSQRPGPHRLEQVATLAEVAYVNDSKATNPHAAAAALRSFGAPGSPSVVWIAGGLGKGLDFADLAAVVRERVRVAVTVGRSGPEIAALTRRLGVPTVEAGTLGRAVREAAARARAGDTVLLAPACASMDQFRDYAERGQAFRDAVAAVASPHPAKEGAGGR
ncbi:MAG TPA: UDP-N-acetylmuramoyl-L-alanine--D-glutamate ligase [Egibacteraceae bacterium]|nr:UDP-N-acetylmuramoyl-L-alanine--D-glutamate ligase [Egibacteraceae bacterium]